MRSLFLVSVSFFLSLSLSAQPLFFSDTGEISFFSSAPFEDIDATSEEATGFLNLETGELRFRMPIKSFEFPNSLMQKHFNTQYMESDTYPNADFKGQITDTTQLNQLSTSPTEVPVSGQLTIRDITKTYEMTATLVREGEGYRGTTSFVVPLEAHDVKIPKLMFKAIAEEIEVKVNVHFMPYSKEENR